MQVDNDGVAMVTLQRPKLMHHPWRSTQRNFPAKFQLWWQQMNAQPLKASLPRWRTQDWLSSSIPPVPTEQYALVSRLLAIESQVAVDPIVRTHLTTTTSFERRDVVADGNNIQQHQPSFSLPATSTNDRKRPFMESGSGSDSNDKTSSEEDSRKDEDDVFNLRRRTKKPYRGGGGGGGGSGTSNNAFDGSTKYNRKRNHIDDDDDDDDDDESSDDNNYGATMDDTIFADDFWSHQRAAQVYSSNNSRGNGADKQQARNAYFLKKQIPYVVSLSGTTADRVSVTAHVYDVPNWMELEPVKHTIAAAMSPERRLEMVKEAARQFNLIHCHPTVAANATRSIFGVNALQTLEDANTAARASSNKSSMNQMTPPITYVSQVRLQQTCGVLPDPENPRMPAKRSLIRLEFQSVDAKYLNTLKSHFKALNMACVNDPGILTSGEIRFVQFMLSRGMNAAPNSWLTVGKWREPHVFCTCTQVEIYVSVYDLVLSIEENGTTPTPNKPLLSPSELPCYFERHDVSVMPIPTPLIIPDRPPPYTQLSWDIEQSSNIGRSTHFPDPNLPEDKVICINNVIYRNGALDPGYVNETEIDDEPERLRFIRTAEDYAEWKRTTPHFGYVDAHTRAMETEASFTYFCLAADGTVPEFFSDHPQYTQMQRFAQKDYMNERFPIGNPRNAPGASGKPCSTPDVMLDCQRVRRYCHFFDHLASADWKRYSQNYNRTTSTSFAVNNQNDGTRQPSLNPNVVPPLFLVIPTLFQDKSQEGGVFVHCYGTEFETIMSFRDTLIDIHPDNLTAHNGCGFDWRVLQTRINLLNFDSQPFDDNCNPYIPDEDNKPTGGDEVVVVGEDEDDDDINNMAKNTHWKHLPMLHRQRPGAKYKYASEVPAPKSLWPFSSRFLFLRTPFIHKAVKTKAKTTDFYYPRFHGCNDLDTLTYFRSAYTQQYDEFSLNFLSQQCLNDEKVELSIPMMNQTYWNGHYRLAVVYCDYDCILPAALSALVDMMGGLSAQACDSYMSLEQKTKDGSLACYGRLLAIVGHELGYFMERITVKSPRTLKGGKVLSPEVGFYPVGVPTLDFEGHYTTAMRAYNLCMSTHVIPFDPVTFQPIKLMYDIPTVLQAQVRHFTEVTLPSIYGVKTQPKSIAPYDAKEIETRNIPLIEVKRRIRKSADYDLLFPRSSQCTMFMNPNLDQRSYEGLSEGDICPVTNFVVYRPDMYVANDGDTPNDNQVPCRGFNYRGITPIIEDRIAAGRRAFRKGPGGQEEIKGNPLWFDKKTQKWLCAKAKRRYANLEAKQIAKKLLGNSIYGAAGGGGILFFGYMPNTVTLACRILTKYSWNFMLTRWMPNDEEYTTLKRYYELAVRYKHLYPPKSRLAEFAKYIAARPFPNSPDDGDQVDSPLMRCENDLDVLNPTLISKWYIKIIYGDTDSIMAALLGVLPNPLEYLTAEEIALADGIWRTNPSLIPAHVHARVLKLDFERRKFIISMSKRASGQIASSFRDVHLPLVNMDFEKMLYPYVSMEAQKCYFGEYYEKPQAPEKVHRRGFDIKRDVILILRQILGAAVNVILETHSPTALQQCIESKLDELMETRGLIYDIPTIRKYCLSKGLNQPNYDKSKSPPGHFLANGRFAVSYPGAEYRIGDRLHVFQVHNPKVDKSSKRAMALEQAKKMLQYIYPSTAVSRGATPWAKLVPASLTVANDMIGSDTTTKHNTQEGACDNSNNNTSTNAVEQSYSPPIDFIPSQEEFLAYAPGDNANHLTKPLMLGRKSDDRYGRQTLTPRYFLLDLQHTVHLCERRIVLLMSAMNAKMNHVEGSLDWIGETLVRRYEGRAARILAHWYGSSITRKASHLGAKSTAQIVAESKRYTKSSASFMTRFLTNNNTASLSSQSGVAAIHDSSPDNDDDNDGIVISDDS